MAKANIEALMRENAALKEQVQRLEALVASLVEKLEKSQQKRKPSTFLMSLPFCSQCVPNDHPDVVQVGSSAKKCKICGTTASDVRFVTMRMSVNSIANKSLRILAKNLINKNPEVVELAEKLQSQGQEPENGQANEEDEAEFEF